MDHVRNPYTPNAGAEPPALAGRQSELDTFSTLLRRLEKGRTEQTMIITGLRGVGKTVLLGRFRDEAERAGWHVVEIEATKSNDQDFRALLGMRLRSALLDISPRAHWNDIFARAASVLSSFTLTLNPEGSWTLGTTQVEPLEGKADSSILAYDLVDVFVEVAKAARDRKTGIALLIDEVQFLSKGQLEALISALHKITQLRLPLTMVGAGLPQVAELTGDAKSYSERLFRFPVIGNLSREDAEVALIEPAREEGELFEADAVDRVFEVTEGYPYFIQELGSAIWDSARLSPFTGEDVEVALITYQDKLDSSFFRVRFDRATELQRAYMRAMAELGPEPQKAADVAHVLGRESTQVAPTRAELISMGLLYTPEFGYAAFTVPQFDRFMVRAVTELLVPPVRGSRRRRGKRSS